MARVNVPAMNTRKTHEGITAHPITKIQELRRSVMANMLWEDEFYEDGVSNAQRIAELIPKIDPIAVREIAFEARTKMKLRHIPLLIVREMARGPKNHRMEVADTLVEIIQRPDELTEFLAIYWKDDKDQPLSAQVKKGLAQAFAKFDKYSLAKYNRDNDIKLRDVLFLTHAKPKEQEAGETVEASGGPQAGNTRHLGSRTQRREGRGQEGIVDPPAEGRQAGSAGLDSQPSQHGAGQCSSHIDRGCAG